jgi:hypothetical protein
LVSKRAISPAAVKSGFTARLIRKADQRFDAHLARLKKCKSHPPLALVAEFPDGAPVVLSGIAEEESTPRPSGRKQHARG